jgi:hypothetical protein
MVPSEHRLSIPPSLAPPSSLILLAENGDYQLQQFHSSRPSSVLVLEIGRSPSRLSSSGSLLFGPAASDPQTGLSAEDEGATGEGGQV